MGRYETAYCRLCRRAGDKLMIKGSRCVTKCTMDKREAKAGPKKPQRRRLSERGQQLRDKQTARFLYGVMEKQFHRLFEEAERMPGVTGDTLMVLLERRLDNVVFRLGFADSRSQSRQLVQHGHFMVNGKKTDIPSYSVKESDVIGWRAGSTKNEYYKQLVENIGSRALPNWLNLDKEKMEGKVVSIPTPEDVDVKINGKAIVEYYSR